MTRINCVPVQELSDAHLGAEYRELPRIFRLVRLAIARGEVPNLDDVPAYTLGKGHCRFFYPRLNYLVIRYAHIVAECERRGRLVSHPKLPTAGIPGAWFGNWQPTPQAMATNRARIAERSQPKTPKLGEWGLSPSSSYQRR